MPDVVDIKDRARLAEDKPAAFGPDVDTGVYGDRASERGAWGGLDKLSSDDRKRVEEVGFDASGHCRSGSYVQIDHSVVFAAARERGLEVMDITEALRKYDWLRDYWWRLVQVDADKYTARAELRLNRGYFLRALPGVKAEFPLQACLYMGQEGLSQNVHNIVIAEEGSELHIITGCATSPSVHGGLHVGVSEFYVKRGAKLTFSMIHSWGRDMHVRPRSGALVEEDGLFLSNYISLRPVQSLQMYPTVWCSGPNAVARYNSVLVAHPGSDLDVGAGAVLEATGARAEVVSRAISKGGHIAARGHLVGRVPGIRAHLECRGLILSQEGSIHAVPELEGLSPDVDMSHEAAVGRIAEEEIRYLMSRGMTGDEATSAIVRGFLDLEIKGLPEHLRLQMQRAIDQAQEGEKLF